MKNTLEGIKSRLDDTEEWISELEERVEEITDAEQNKEKIILKNEDKETSRTTSNVLTFALSGSQ